MPLNDIAAAAARLREYHGRTAYRVAADRADRLERDGAGEAADHWRRIAAAIAAHDRGTARLEGDPHRLPHAPTG